MAVATKKPEFPKWVARVSGNMGTKTCGVPLRSFNFEPHPNVCAQLLGKALRSKTSSRKRAFGGAGVKKMPEPPASRRLKEKCLRPNKLGSCSVGRTSPKEALVSGAGRTEQNWEKNQLPPSAAQRRTDSGPRDARGLRRRWFFGKLRWSPNPREAFRKPRTLERQSETQEIKAMEEQNQKQTRIPKDCFKYSVKRVANLPPEEKGGPLPTFYPRVEIDSSRKASLQPKIAGWTSWTVDPLTFGQRGGGGLKMVSKKTT